MKRVVTGLIWKSAAEAPNAAANVSTLVAVLCSFWVAVTVLPERAFRTAPEDIEGEWMRDAESLTHLVYGEIVKRFHLGTAHVFNSWDQLSEDERARWLAVFAEVRKTLAAESEERATSKESPPMSVH